MNSLKIKFALVFLGFAMLVTGGYLTLHYFEVRFPEGLGSASLCNINSYFSCDKVISSSLAQIAGVPISIFGFLMGGFILAKLFIRSASYDSTLMVALAANAVVCCALLFSSIFVLHGICPFCALYYVLSFLSLGVMAMLRPRFKLNLGIAALMFVTVCAVCFGARAYATAKEKEMAAMGAELLKQFSQVPKTPGPSAATEFKIADHPSAKIKMVIFSDFQCPACRMFAQMIPALISRYGENLDIQYYFFPLDSACNSKSGPLHPFACQASYVASCLPGDFTNVHDELFANQDKFSNAWLNEFAMQKGVGECAASSAAKDKVLAMLKAAEPVQIGSTPTFLVNGTKVEGVVPLGKLIALFDELILQ